MGTITLVGYLVAKEGYTFLFTGGSEECTNCRLRKVCVDKLKVGHVYKVTKVIGIRNRCRINDYVITVEVEEAPVIAAIPKKFAVEGLTIRYRKVDCDVTNCLERDVCSPKLLPEEAKVKVVRVLGKVDCGRTREPMVKAEVLVID